MIAGNADLYSSCTISANGSPASTLVVNLFMYSSKGTLTNSILQLYFFSISAIFSRRAFSPAVVPAGFRSHQAATLITRPPRSTGSASGSAGSSLGVSAAVSVLGAGVAGGVSACLAPPPLQAVIKNNKQISNKESPFIFLTLKTSPICLTPC
ncbi:Uncharacterised protein [Actinobacillus pleuropneumoniae]|nr:Uncharacterised protein [Actinobacillus pleuropneumoniae]